MKVIELINRGGFGKVEKVSLKDGSFGALKTFDPQFSVNTHDELEKLKKRFEREVRILSSLDSKFVIPVVDYDLKTENPWFLMPLADCSLADTIENFRNDQNAAQSAITDILNSLEYLHKADYVHRDLKPQNVLLHEGKWKLSDFGLILPPSTQTTKLTSTYSNWGTAGYCAPEQALDFRSVDSTADIYAFGCILHDIYSGDPRIPYQQYSAPEPVGIIIEKCTEISPNRRFKTVQKLRGALVTILSTPKLSAVSKGAEQWEEKLKDVEKWTVQEFESFVRFIKRSPSSEDRWALFREIDEEKSTFLEQLDHAVWETLTEEYCNWTRGSFSFAYCDVLIRRLELAFDRGSTSLKARVAIAAAELGASHNRWFVMERLIKMCGPNLDDHVAGRIAIEISVEEAEENFTKCADRIGLEINAYHPKIRSMLAESD